MHLDSDQIAIILSWFETLQLLETEQPELELFTDDSEKELAKLLEQNQ